MSWTPEYPSRKATALLLALVTCAFGAAEDSPIGIYERALLEKRIRPDEQGLRNYLTALHPTESQRAAARTLISRLGSENYAEREEATIALLISPALPVGDLTAALNHAPDPEVRWRAKSILLQGQSQSAATLYAALKTIQEKQLPGLVSEVIRAMPLCAKSHQQAAAHAALIATARQDDSATLLRAMQHDKAEVRAAAAEALSAVNAVAAVPRLKELLRDEQEADVVQLAASRALANLGDRASLDSLLKLLASDDVNVRLHSAMIMRRLTGKHFGFAAYDQPDRRNAVLKKWSEWVHGDGRTAELTFPLDISGAAASFLNGNLLLAFGYKNKVAEYDPAGKEVWTYPAKGAWSAEKLPNGNVLIAAYNENRVIEVDGAGKVVWEQEAASVLNARPLENGNVLACLHSGSKVVEYNREKKVIWEFSTKGSCCDAHRLPNGNTLVAAGNSVVEVSPDKKNMWEYDCMGQVYGVTPLESGNMLISILSGKVIELTPDKKIVWEFAEANPVDAVRLANGNTLITGSKRFVEVSPDKKIVWEKEECNYGTARR